MIYVHVEVVRNIRNAMGSNEEIVFFPNTEDNLHCYQACLRMVLSAYGVELDWEQLEQLSGYNPKRYTWPAEGVIALQEFIPGVRFYSGMDYKEFAHRGEEYYKELTAANPAWFALQQAHASPHFHDEQLAAKKLVDMNLFRGRTPNPGFIVSHIAQNYVVALIDTRAVFHTRRSEGHYVLLTNKIGDTLLANDPGLPARENYHISLHDFERGFQGDAIIIPKHKRS
jgi:hypothetical protein